MVPSPAVSEPPAGLGSYGYRYSFATRWNDNDQYGHLNNVVYYEAMDTTINRWLIEEAGMDPVGGDQITVCAASSCTFSRSVSYPVDLEVGLRAGRVGRTSVSWELGLFSGADPAPAATGSFTHVFVDPRSLRPVPVPAALRTLVVDTLS
jgi:acyl-CoA thioester hydrolase